MMNIFTEHFEHRIDSLGPVSTIFEKAADIQDQSGYCRGHWRTEDGRVCLEGAVSEAAGFYEDENSMSDLDEPCPVEYEVEYRYLVDRLAEYMTKAGYLSNEAPEPWHYNDTVAESKADVVRVLRETAAYHEDKENGRTEVPSEQKEASYAVE